MIRLLTAFLGLVAGVHPVELAVTPEVASVEVYLDDAPAGRLDGAPWTLEVDFGDRLVPHELVAVARGGDGRELDRLERWINLTPATRGDWTALAVTVAEGYELPPPEEMSAWFVVDGGPVPVDRVERGLAEVAIVRDPNAQGYLDGLVSLFYDASFQKLRALQGGDQVERLGEDLEEDWTSLDVAALPARQAPAVDQARKSLRAFARLGPDAMVRFVSPFAAAPSRVSADHKVFHSSQQVKGAGFLWMTQEMPAVYSFFRLADAVAVSARELHASGRRRAVVILLADSWDDQSLFAPSQVLSFARDVQVPVFAWSAAREGVELPGWGEIDYLQLDDEVYQSLAHIRGPLGQAVERLRLHLESQRVVWLRGRFLPHTIALAGDAPEEVRLVGP